MCVGLFLCFGSRCVYGLVYVYVWLYVFGSLGLFLCVFVHVCVCVNVCDRQPPLLYACVFLNQRERERAFRSVEGPAPSSGERPEASQPRAGCASAGR